MGSKTPGLNEIEGPGVAPVYLPGKGSPGYGLDSQARNRNLSGKNTVPCSVGRRSGISGSDRESLSRTRKEDLRMNSKY